jgi:hypothetical protein
MVPVGAGLWGPGALHPEEDVDDILPFCVDLVNAGRL